MKLFISYAATDRPIALAIEECCEQFGIKYFRDQKDIEPGSSISARVGDGLKACSHLVVIVSPASERSQWVPFEIGRAIERGMTVMPYLTHPSIRPPAFLPDVLGLHGIEELKKQLEIFVLSARGLADEVVEKLASVPNAIAHMDISDAAKRALGSSVNLVLSGFQEHLEEIVKGRISVRGPEINRVFAIFVNCVQRTFKALSRDDLQYWVSEDSRQYLAHNQLLLDRECRVERIFVLKRRKLITDDQRAAMCSQLRMGVTIRVAYVEPCRAIVGVDGDYDLDFGLFDNFAVSFFRFTIGRVHKLSTSSADYNRYSNIYDSVVNLCERFNAKKVGPESSIALTDEQLSEWVRAHNERIGTADAERGEREDRP